MACEVASLNVWMVHNGTELKKVHLFNIMYSKKKYLAVNKLTLMTDQHSAVLYWTNAASMGKYDKNVAL